MYHAHFGLERGLFGEGIAADTAVFRTAKHDRLIAHFKLALGSPSSAVALRGSAGVGKTTLTSAALRMTSTRLALAWLGGTATNPTELLELILVELGVNTLRTTRMERVQLWRQFQGEIRATDSRLFLIVERTEDLSADVLHSLDQLSAPDAAGNPGANLVLLGNEGLDAHLEAPVLDSLRQRIRLRGVLEPFTESELQDYLRHQAACAGGSYDRIFAPGTVAALYRYSRGIARLVNNLCESALDVAAVQQHRQLTAELVARTAVSLLGLAEPVPLPRTTGAAIAEQLGPVERRAAPRPPAGAPGRPAEPALAPPSGEPVPPLPPVERVAVAPVAVAPTAPRPPSPPPSRTPAPPTPAAPLAAPATAAPMLAAQPVELEFDGGATDITDVALIDFPVLTDAIDSPAAAVAAKPVFSPPLTPASGRPPAPTPAPPVAASKPAAAKPPASRIETAYTATRPPSPALAAAAPAVTPPAPPPRSPVVAARPAAAAMTPANPDDDHELRETQTMRAIAVAQSIDDISSSMAETLFSDAELDLVTAALAAEWPDDEDEAAAAPASAREKPAAAKQLPADDPLDLFELGDDAPLELIDDSAQSPTDRPQKTASR